MPSKKCPLVNPSPLGLIKSRRSKLTEEVLKIKADRVCHGVKYLNRWPQNYDSASKTIAKIKFVLDRIFNTFPKPDKAEIRKKNCRNDDNDDL